MSRTAPYHDRMAQTIFILTGAGISAESGVRTFRDNGGLWEDHRVEDVATPEAFARDPALVQRFYNARRAALKTVEPNPAHNALGQLDAHLQQSGGQLHLVTQNVDDLHERGGVNHTVHMHGELSRAFCTACDHRWKEAGDLDPAMPCPACGVRGGPRPDIVWFGEMPYHMERIERSLARSDLFVSIGTSGAVYPAAGFVQAAQSMGITTLELNLEPSMGSAYFDEARHGAASVIVPEWVEEIISGP